MKCPKCGKEEDKVLESRAIEEGSAIRRRRECLDCETRYTSYERIEERPLMVVKKDGTRQPFNRQKLLSGLSRATEKRPVSQDQISDMVVKVEKKLRKDFVSEVPSNEIGELLMEKLHNLDQVSYVRFASVYRKFKSIKDFVEEVESLN